MNRYKSYLRILTFLIVHDGKTVYVYPVVGEDFASFGFWLGNFIGMVWKLKVCPSTMDVDGISKFQSP